ncbi:MAG TPA: hypothetical protein VII23_23790 [Terriglobales bacterium]
MPKTLFLGDIGRHKDKTLGYEFTVKSVCRNCNNGWMHRLEDETIPIMGPMLSEQSSFLDVVSQRTIAAWALKTAMVLDSTAIAKHRPLFYSRAERISLRESLRIPLRTFVWLGHSLDFGLACSSIATHLTILSPFHPYSLKESTLGQVSTFLVCNLAIQVMTVHVPAEYSDGAIDISPPEGPWGDLLVSVWPPSRLSYWPPPLAFDSSISTLDLRTLTNRWKMGNERVVF